MNGFTARREPVSCLCLADCASDAPPAREGGEMVQDMLR